MKEETIKRRRKQKINALWKNYSWLIGLLAAIQIVFAWLLIGCIHDNREISRNDVVEVSGIVQDAYIHKGTPGYMEHLIVSIDNVWYVLTLTEGPITVDMVQGKVATLLVQKEQDWLSNARGDEIVKLQVEEDVLYGLNDANRYRKETLVIGTVGIPIMWVAVSAFPLYLFLILLREDIEAFRRDRVYNKKRYLRSESNADSAKKTPKPSKDKIKRA